MLPSFVKGISGNPTLPVITYKTSHISWYSDYGNVTRRNGGKEQYETMLKTGNTSHIRRQSGRSTKMDGTKADGVSSSGKLTRSMTSPYNKSLCVISQEPEGILHKVELESVGKRMYDISESKNDTKLMACLNQVVNPDDAVANDIQYHLQCWVKLELSVLGKTRANNISG